MKRPRESKDSDVPDQEEEPPAEYGMSAPTAKVPEREPAQTGVNITCSWPPHQAVLAFASYQEYEAHYSTVHTNRCVKCRKNFPSSHLLDIHIEERHDSLVAVRRERGERTFSCFVQGCDKKTFSPRTRRLHLIDKHMYPENYFFAVTRDGIDGRQSLLVSNRRRHHIQPKANNDTDARPQSPKLDDAHKSAQHPVVPQATHPADPPPAPPDQGLGSEPAEVPDVLMDNLGTAMSALRLVPTSIRFGRRRGGGFAKQ